MLRIVPETPARVRPVLKWAGGKRWFVDAFGDDMFDRVVERGGRYVEPFLGGGAMALHLGIDGMVLGDLESELVITYLVIQQQPEELSTLLGLVGEQVGKQDFYRMRARKPSNPLEVATRMIYLNKLCFNGLFRKNIEGGFNVPFGGSRKMPSLAEISQVAIALRGAEIRCCDALQLIEGASEGDVVYADPPYHGKFSGYTGRGFKDRHHAELAASLRRAWERGVEVYAHNTDSEHVRGLYAWAEIIPLDERRALNSRGSGRGEVPCLLAVGTQ